MLGNGTDMPEDIIKSVKRGLYAVNFGGGQVDITNGKFVFSASEAYLIEDGKVTRPVKGATLIGNGPEALKSLSPWSGMISHSTKELAPAGKAGQRARRCWNACTVRLDPHDGSAEQDNTESWQPNAKKMLRVRSPTPSQP